MANIWNLPLNIAGTEINFSSKLQTRLGYPVRFLAYDRLNDKYLVRVVKGYNLDYDYKVNTDGSRYTADNPHFEDIMLADAA